MAHRPCRSLFFSGSSCGCDPWETSSSRAATAWAFSRLDSIMASSKTYSYHRREARGESGGQMGGESVKKLGWLLVAVLGAAAFSILALARGESINAAWIVIAGVCSYAIGYRFYSRFIAFRV